MELDKKLLKLQERISSIRFDSQEDDQLEELKDRIGKIGAVEAQKDETHEKHVSMLEDRIRELQNEINDIEEVAKTNKKRHRLNANKLVKEKKTLLQTVEKALAQKNNEVLKVQAAVQKEEKHVKGIVGSIESLNRKINRLEKDLPKTVEQSVKDHLNTFDQKFEKETMVAIAPALKSLEEVVQSQEEFYPQFKEFSKKIEALEEARSLLSKRIDEVNKDTLKKAENEIENRINILGGKLEGKAELMVQESVTPLTKGLKEQEELREDIIHLSEDMRNLKESHQKIDQNILGSLAKFEERFGRMREKIQLQEEKVENALEKDVQRISEKTDIFRGDVSEAKRDIEHLKDSVEAYHEGFKRLSSQFETVITPLESQISKVDARITFLENKVDKVSQDVDILPTLKDQIENLKLQHQKLESLGVQEGIHELKMVQKEFLEIKKDAGLLSVLKKEFPQLEEKVIGIHKNSLEHEERVANIEKSISFIRESGENIEDIDQTLEEHQEKIHSAEAKILSIEGKFNETISKMYDIQHQQASLNEHLASVVQHTSKFEHELTRLRKEGFDADNLAQMKSFVENRASTKDVQELKKLIEDAKKKNKEIIELLLDKIGV